jgi:hypothetical protein
MCYFKINIKSNKLGFFMFILIFYSQMAISQNNLPPDAEEGIYSIYYGGYKKEVSVVLYKDSLYIPILECLSFLKIFYNENDLILNNINGYISTSEDKYEINIKKKYYISIGGEKNTINKEEMIQISPEIYFTPGLIEKIFNFNISIFKRDLILHIKSLKELPILIEERRLKKYKDNIAGNIMDEEKILPVVYDRQWKILDGGMVNYQIKGIQSKNTNLFYYNTNLGIQLLGGEMQYNAIGNFDLFSKNSFYNYNIRWKYSFDENPFISYISLGNLTNISTRSNNFSQDQLSNQILEGIQISNESSKMPTVFNDIVIEGNTEPGWQIELYSNNQLTSFIRADNAGYYNFKLPLRYGNTNIDLKIYGPKGECITKSEIISVPSEFLSPGTVKYIVNAGKGSADSVFTGNGRISFGLTKWLTNSTMVEKSEFNNGFKIVNNISLRPFSSIVLNALYSPDKFLINGLRFDLGEYGNYYILYSKYFEQGNLQKKSNSLEFNLSFPRLFSLPLSIMSRGNNISYENSENSMLNTNIYVYLNNYVFSLCHNIAYGSNEKGSRILTSQTIYPRFDYTWYDKPNFISFLKNTRFSIGSNYNIMTRKVLNYDLSIQQELFSGANVQFNYNKNIIAGISSFNISLQLSSSILRAYSTYQKSNSSEPNYSEDLSGSIGFDPGYFNFYPSNITRYDGYGYSAAVVRFFVDKNNNNIFDKGEEEVKNVDIHIPSAIVEKDNSGRNKVFNMTPGTRYNLFVDKNSIKNPLIISKYSEFSFIADPNTFKAIDIPCYMSGTIEGNAFIIKGESKEGQGRIKVHLENYEKNDDETIMLFSDGTFYKAGVIPGRYKIYIDSTQLKILNCISKPEYINFEVKATEEGDEVSGLNFELIKNTTEKKQIKPSSGVNDDGAYDINNSLKSKSNVEDLKNNNEQEYNVEKKNDYTPEKKENISTNNDKKRNNNNETTPLNEKKTDINNEITKEKTINTGTFITGKIALYTYEDRVRKTFKESSPLSDYTLKISDGKQIFYAVSDKSGKFVFEGIREGKWVLGLYKGAIPKGYRLEQMFYNIEIKKGEKKDVIYKILPAVR